MRKSSFIIILLCLFLVPDLSIGQDTTPDAAPENATPTAAAPQTPPTQDPTPPEIANQDAATPAQKATVTDVGFEFKDGKSDLTLKFNHDVNVEKSVNDNQVILDVKNATIPSKWARKIDTSQYKSNIALISPYQMGDSVRVVLQLKQAGNVDVNPSGNEIVAQIDNQSGSAPTNNEVADTQAPANPPAEETKSISATGSDNGGAKDTVESTGDPNDSLNQFFTSQQNKHYVGKRITLQLRDAPIADVFRIVSEASEFNIVLGDDVKGKMLLNLTDVPWDQALDLILHSFKLGAERVGNVLRVVGLDALTKEKESQSAAKQATEAAEPLVVKIFPISFAKVDELKKILSDFLSKEVGQVFSVPGAGANTPPVQTQGATRGTIQIDTRTNSLIVRDTPSTIEKFKRIIKELDTQTPQVLIEAKFVQVSENNTKSIEGRLFTSSRELDSTGNLGFTVSNTKDNFGGIFGGTSGSSAINLQTGGFALSSIGAGSGGASFGISPHAKLLPGINEIGAFLSVLEAETHAKIISSPRVIAQNKEEATISQGSVVQIPNQAGLGGTGGFTAINALLKLVVTPQVTNEGSITLKISFSEDTVTDTVGSTDTKKVETLVNVDSGSTLVIGGIYSNNLTEVESGIPFLRDLPVIGVLFGSKTKNLKKTELFIFLNPRILNEKESGLKG